MVTINFERKVNLMNIPNIITIFRIILIPLFLFVFHSNIENRLLYSGLIFLLAGISDILDGHIARKYNLTSKLGTILDPFADKMMSFAILISFTMKSLIPSWVLIILVIKEVVMIVGGGILYLFYEKHAVPADKIGKLATISFYAAILSIFIHATVNLSKILLIITVAINILAFNNYLRKFILIKKNKSQLVDK